MSARPLVVGVALGLERRALEKQCPPGALEVVQVGVGADGVESAASAALDRFPDLRGLVCAGICGALDASLDLGDVVVPERGVHGDGSPAWVADPELRASVAGDAAGGAAVTVARPAWSAVAKRELRERTGATICEMEASAWASACAQRGIPFAMVRAVSDTATDDLPDLGRLGDPSASRWTWARLLNPAVAVRIPSLARRASRAAAAAAAHLASVLG